MSDEIDTGALGPSGRFARMEAALERIEAKLDLKADVTRVAELEARHTALARSIDDMTSGRMTTPLSSLYLERFSAMEKAVDRLEDAEGNRNAVLLAAKEKADAQVSRLAIVVAVATIGNVLFSIAMRMLA